VINLSVYLLISSVPKRLCKLHLVDPQIFLRPQSLDSTQGVILWPRHLPPNVILSRIAIRSCRPLSGDFFASPLAKAIAIERLKTNAAGEKVVLLFLAPRLILPC
jgi:hypothetical protein